jgi:hypothetical protein
MSYATCAEIMRTGRDRMESRTSIGARVMSWSFALIGAGLILLAVFGDWLFSDGSIAETIVGDSPDA